MTELIAGIDPGKTTGLVVIQASGPGKLDSVLSAENLPFDEVPHVVNNIVHYVDFIAIERFTISLRTIKSNRYSEALDVIGGVKFLIALADSPPELIQQNASDAKTAYKDATIDGYAISKKIPKPHARDALRHALLSTHKVFR